MVRARFIKISIVLFVAALMTLHLPLSTSGGYQPSLRLASEGDGYGNHTGFFNDTSNVTLGGTSQIVDDALTLNETHLFNDFEDGTLQDWKRKSGSVQNRNGELWIKAPNLDTGSVLYGYKLFNFTFEMDFRIVNSPEDHFQVYLQGLLSVKCQYFYSNDKMMIYHFDRYTYQNETNFTAVIGNWYHLKIVHMGDRYSYSINDVEITMDIPKLNYIEWFRIDLSRNNEMYFDNITIRT